MFKKLFNFGKKILNSFKNQNKFYVHDKNEETVVLSTEKLKISPKKNVESCNGNPWQSPNKKNGKEKDLVIGFDLGTSCTKIIIQDRQVRKAFAVPFDELSDKINHYLLPTKLFLNSNKLMSLNPSTIQISNIKIKFMDKQNKVFRKYGIEATSQELISAYIGLVLKRVCQWFWDTKQNEYSDVIINWELNVGIPAKTWDDTELSGAMKKVALAGWNLSLGQKSSISTNDVKKAIDAADEQIQKEEYHRQKGQLHPDLVKSVPEIIAEVMGFAQSPLRKDGMYLLVDVGASTLDISTFNIYKDQNEENIFTIFCSDVKLLGAYKLHQYRIQKFLKKYEEKLKILDESYDGISALPDTSVYKSILNGNDKEKFENADLCYLNNCSIVLRKVIKETKECKNPISDVWTTGIPAFLCGGGSQVDLYKELIPYSGRKLRNTNINGFEIKKLPKPDNLENDDILPQDYHRFAVSYGLSFSVDNMGRIIPPRDVDDIALEIPVVNIDDKYIDKDMV